MKKLEARLKDKKATVVVFQHAGNNDAIKVKYLVQSLGKTYGDKVNIIRYDCSYNGAPKVKYHLEEYPTWILFKEGQELMRLSGEKTEDQLIDMINRGL